MPFPATQRVLYGVNPLRQVICQLRFPTILRIVSELPAEFQEKIRKRYPEYRSVEPSTDLPLAVKQLLGVTGDIGVKTHEFVSEDGIWTISLTKDFLALSCSKYTRWEEFKHHLEHSCVEPLSEVYCPAFYSRIGLRYVDLVSRTKLGLEALDWSDLLQAHIAGELVSPEVAASVVQTSHDIVVKLQENELVRIQHGLRRIEEQGRSEDCYLIDSDFFSENRTEPNDVYSILDGFNRQAGCLFRWAITDRLHEAMEPTAIGH